jgi:hypothetical protein
VRNPIEAFTKEGPEAGVEDVSRFVSRECMGSVQNKVVGCSTAPKDGGSEMSSQIKRGRCSG